MKKIIWISVACFLLAGCTQATVTEQNKDVATDSIIPEAEDEGLYDIKLGDKELTVPFSVKEMEAAGYTIDNSTVENVKRGVDNIVYYVDDNGGMIVTNLGSYEEECEIEDAYVIDILADLGNTDTTHLQVYGGVTFDSSIEEIEEIFGEPLIEDNGMAMYSKVEEGAYMDGVYVATMDDYVMRVEVLSTKDFIDWDEEEEETEAQSE